MKTTQRICQGCKKTFNRSELIKITKLPQGILKINPSSKELGRSLYVCKNPDCINILIKKKKIKTALKYSNAQEIERIEKELVEMI